MEFNGIYPALVTPFDSDGKVDGKAMEKLIDRLIAKGVDGFYVCGSTGESLLLSPRERRQVMGLAKEIVNKRKPVIAHIGCVAFGDTVGLGEEAARLGVDAVSAIPPIYFKYSAKELAQYFFDIAAATALPLIVYNLPAMTGISFDSENIRDIFRHEGIAGIKNTSPDIYQTQRMISKYPDKAIINGFDELYLSSLAIGVKCAIGSAFNIMPEKYIELRQRYEAGDLSAAQALQDNINAVIEALIKVGVFKGIKAALERQGLSCGSMRKPFLPITAEETPVIDEIMRLL